MNAIVSRFVFAGVLFLFTLISGVWLSHSGKPLNMAIVTVHKLIALAAVIVISVNVYHLYRTLEFRTFIELVVIAITGLLIITLFISGAFLSLGKSLPEAILRVHQVAPLLALTSSAMTIYLLASSKS